MDFLEEEDEVDDPADPDFTPMLAIKRKKKCKYVFRSSKKNAQEGTSSDEDSSDNSSENESNGSSSESASDSQPPRKMFAPNNSICNNDVAVQRNPINVPNQARTSLEVEATPQMNKSSVTTSRVIPTKSLNANESKSVNSHGTSSEDTELTILENVPNDQKSARALNSRRIKRNRELKKTLILKSFKTITKQSVILKSFLVANKKLVPEDSDNLPLCGVGLEMNRTLDKEEIFLLYGKIQDPVYNYAVEKSFKVGPESETKDYIAPMVLKVANVALNSNSSLKLVKSFLKARVLLDDENDTVLLTLYPITKNQAFLGVNENTVDDDVVVELPDNVTSTTGLSDSEDATQPTANTDGTSSQLQVAVDSSCNVEPPSMEVCEEIDILTLSDDEPSQTVNIVPRKVVKYQRHNRTEPVVRKTKDKSLTDPAATDDLNQTILEEPSISNETEENLPNDDTGPIIRMLDEDPVFFKELLSDKTGNMGKGINLLSVTKLALISSEVNSTHTDNPNNAESSNELKLAAEAALERVGPCIVRRIKLKNGNVVYVYKAAGLMPPIQPNNSNSSDTKFNSSPATTNEKRNDETPKTVNSDDTLVSHKGDGDGDGVLNKSPKKARPGPRSVKEKRKEREKNRKMSPTDTAKLSTCTSNTSILEETSNHSTEKIQNAVYDSPPKDIPQSSLINKPSFVANYETNVTGGKKPLRRGRSTITSNDSSVKLPEIPIASTSRIPESGSRGPLSVTGSPTQILAKGSEPHTPGLVSVPQIPQMMGVQFPIGSSLPNVQGSLVESQGMCLVNNMNPNAANWLSTENAPFIMMMVPAGSTMYNSTEPQPLAPTIISCESISEQQYKNDILDVES